MQERKDLVNLVGKRYGQLKGEEPCADIERLSKADHVGPNCLGMPHFTNLAVFLTLFKTPLTPPPYLIFVTGATGGAHVIFFGRCNFLQI